MMTREEYLKTAETAQGQRMMDLALFNAMMAVAAGQGEFLAAIEAMKSQGPPQVGGTRMMTCGDTIGGNACNGQVTEQLYIITHQSSGSSTFQYRCCKCGSFTNVKRVATASLPPELQPPAKAAETR